MKNHVFRPLAIIVALVVLILVARLFIVPKDFGVGERGYMYGWHRAGNENEWKAFPVKYNFSSGYCKDCHGDNYEGLMKSPHAIIPCEDCHGPVRDHPSDPPKLAIDTSRAQCLRCHSPLPYPSSGRAEIRGVDPEAHNTGVECSCHDPHKPALESMR